MFSYKKFLRSIPAPLVEAYLKDRAFDVPEAFDWAQAEDQLVKSLGKIIDASEDAKRSEVISEWLEASSLASELGCRAILNSVGDDDATIDLLREMESHQQRALWTYWQREKVFAKAKELLFFDDRSQRQETKRMRIPAGLPVSTEDADLQALADDVRKFYRKKEGCGDSCDIEITPRHQEGSLQFTIYVQGLANNQPEFTEGRVRRRRSDPAIALALVYHPKEGLIETAVRGGKPYHQMLQDKFKEHLLKVDIDAELLLPEKFKLQNLKFGVALPGAGAHGIDQVRLKNLVLYATDGSGGTVTIEAPGKDATFSAERLAADWFSDRNPLHAQFIIVRAAIALHLIPLADGTVPTPVAVEFRRDGTINWGKISEQHRLVVEHLLVQWGLVDSPLDAAA